MWNFEVHVLGSIYRRNRISNSVIMPISCSHNLVFCLLSNLSWVTLKIVQKRRFAASTIIVIRIWISKLQFSMTVLVSGNMIRLELKIKHERRLRHCLDCHELIDKSNSFSATSYIKLQKQQVYFARVHSMHSRHSRTIINNCISNQEFIYDHDFGWKTVYRWLLENFEDDT